MLIDAALASAAVVATNAVVVATVAVTAVAPSLASRKLPHRQLKLGEAASARKVRGCWLHVLPAAFWLTPIDGAWLSVI